MEKKNSIERFKYAEYALALVAGMSCWILFLGPILTAGFGGLILLLGVALALGSLKYSSPKRKILSNVGSIFAWSMFVTEVLIIALLIMSLIGGMASGIS